MLYIYELQINLESFMHIDVSNNYNCFVYQYQYYNWDIITLINLICFVSWESFRIDLRSCNVCHVLAKETLRRYVINEVLEYEWT